MRQTRPSSSSAGGALHHQAVDTSPGAAESQLWRQTLDALDRGLPKTQDSQAHLRLQALFEEGLMETVGKGVREKVARQLLAEEEGLDREIAAYDAALESLSILLALQAATSPPGTPSASTPGSTTAIGGSHHPPKRGRPPKNAVASRSSSISRTSAPPPAPPPAAAVAAAAPAAAAGVPGGGGGGPGSNHPSNFPPIPSVHMVPLAKRDPKERKLELAGQLPLTAGRRVAFRIPVKPTGGAASKANELPPDDDWILAIVRKNIGQDIGRYEVADADMESGGVLHNTTLKAIVPLPTVGAPIDSPANPIYFAPHPVGSLVMAVYPGTTALYKGVVRSRETERPRDDFGSSAPAPVVPKGKKGRPPAMVAVPEAEQRYFVAFEDDGDQVQLIERGDIAEWPGGQGDRR